jgi:putative glutamine amidotransferase
MTKPRIAMTTWRRTMATFLSDRTDLYTLGAEYPQSLIDAGAIPVLLAHAEPEDAARVLEDLDGLVLVGGDDVHPESYGDDHDGRSKGVDARADAWEIALARAAVARRLPVFGICRGFQILNVAFGGSLHQDIADPEGVHRPISGLPHEVMGERHEISITPGCRLAMAYGETHHRVVNTIHHQAVDQVAPGWVATAVAPDGVVEALEPEDPDLPVLAVQWHPEKIREEGDQTLFDWFVRALVIPSLRTRDLRGGGGGAGAEA